MLGKAVVAVEEGGELHGVRRLELGLSSTLSSCVRWAKSLNVSGPVSTPMKQEGLV